MIYKLSVSDAVGSISRVFNGAKLEQSRVNTGGDPNHNETRVQTIQPKDINPKQTAWGQNTEKRLRTA